MSEKYTARPRVARRRRYRRGDQRRPGVAQRVGQPAHHRAAEVGALPEIGERGRRIMVDDLHAQRRAFKDPAEQRTPCGLRRRRHRIHSCVDDHRTGILAATHATLASMDVRKIAGALGAEVRGVDLAQPLDAEVAAGLRRAWLEHLVLFFRDQALAPGQFMAFARAHRASRSSIRSSTGSRASRRSSRSRSSSTRRCNFGGIWHSDTTYLDEPPMAIDAARARSAAVRRRHAVRQPVPRLRDAVGRNAAAARRARRGEPLGEGRRLANARGPHQDRRAAKRAARVSSPSIRSCARIRKPGARRCT